jgi:hypothetical protein
MNTMKKIIAPITTTICQAASNGEIVDTSNLSPTSEEKAERHYRKINNVQN